MASVFVGISCGARLFLVKAVLAALLHSEASGQGSLSKRSCDAGVMETAVLTSAGHTRLAFLVGSGLDDEKRGRDIVDLLHAPQHVYVVCAGRGMRRTLDAWVREKRFTNVFVLTGPEKADGQQSDVRLRAAHLLLEHHSWDYLIDLAVGNFEPLLSVSVLSRWLATINGTSLAPVGSDSHGVFAIARGHLAEVLAEEGSEEESLQQVLPQLPGLTEADTRSWSTFWTRALVGRCPPATAPLAAFFVHKVGSQQASKQPWGVVSPVEAYDAGERFEVPDKVWMASYQNLTQWLLHALLVQDSEGNQRLETLEAVSRRQLGRPPRRPKTGRGLPELSPAERVARATDQLSARVSFKPLDGVCEVDAAVKGLHLSDCSVEADIFIMERLVVTYPRPALSLLQAASCAEAMPAPPPVLLRVGTAWDGDAEVFHGFTSLVPSLASDDLWLVVVPLLPSAKSDADECKGWPASFKTVWESQAGKTLFIGGGRSLSTGLLWERYLGPSPLLPGSYTVTLSSLSNVLLAKRSFEVLPDDPSSVAPAERLARWPQYFDLVAEIEGQEGLVAEPMTDVPQSRSEKYSQSDETLREQVSGQQKLTPDQKKETPGDKATSDVSLRQPASISLSTDTRSKMAPEEARHKEIMWIRKDVEHHVPKPAVQTTFDGKKRRPASEQERRKRELEWIRRDVELHAPKRKVWKTDRRVETAGRTSASLTSKTSSPVAASSEVSRSPAEVAQRPPLARDELQKREQAWIAKEGERLRSSAAAKQRKVELFSSQKSSAEEATQEASKQTSRRATQKVARKDYQVLELSHAEKERREEAWIKRDIDSHASIRIRRCSAATARETLSSACSRILRRQPPVSKAAEAAGLASKARLPADRAQLVADVKARLKDSIPEEVIDRELPWILDDIAVGEALARQRQ